MSNGKIKKELWTNKEVKFLRNNWSVMTGLQIAQKLGRNRSAIYAKATSLGLRKNIRHKVTTPKTLQAAKVTEPVSIQQKFDFAQEAPKKEVRRAWTPEEDQILRDLLHKVTAAELGRRLGRTRQAICDRIRVKGLKKKTVEAPVKVESKVEKTLAPKKVTVTSNIQWQNLALAIATALNVGLAALVAYLIILGI